MGCTYDGGGMSKASSGGRVYTNANAVTPAPNTAVNTIVATTSFDLIIENLPVSKLGLALLAIAGFVPGRFVS
jgi:hypothetical protein